MKQEAVGHTGMKRLCRRIDLAPWQAVGLLESVKCNHVRKTFAQNHVLGLRFNRIAAYKEALATDTKEPRIDYLGLTRAEDREPRFSEVFLCR